MNIPTQGPFTLYYYCYSHSHHSHLNYHPTLRFPSALQSVLLRNVSQVVFYSIIGSGREKAIGRFNANLNLHSLIFWQLESSRKKL